MNKNILLAMGLLCAMFLAACGSSTKDFDGNATGNDKIFHQVELVKTGTTNQLKITFGMSGLVVIHLAKGGVAALPLSDIAEVEVEGYVVGWAASGGSKKASVANIPVVVVNGVSADDAILISVITKGGVKFFVNPDHVKFFGAKMALRSGMMFYGLAAEDLSFVGSPTNVPPVVTPPTTTGEPLHSFAVSGGAASITFATIDGYIINVSKAVGNYGVSSSVKATDIVRVVWNGDVAGWDTAYGMALTLPTTAITVPVHDIGNIRLVAADGTLYSLNTAKTTVSPGMYLDSRSLIGY